MQNKKTVSWFWVVFWFFIFWPIGIFLLFKKLSGDKSAILKNSKTVSNISYVLIAIGLLYFIMTLTVDGTMIVATILFCGGGIVVNTIARNMKKNGERYKKYISLIINQQITQIDNIAPSVGVSYDIAKKDLQKMIDAGYFVEAYINDDTREIVLAKPMTNVTQEQYPVQTQVQTRVVACKSCGANNTGIVGQIFECDYCGSPLE